MRIKAEVTHHIVSMENFENQPYSLGMVYTDSKGVARVLSDYWLYENEAHQTLLDVLTNFSVPVGVVTAGTYNAMIKQYNRRYHSKPEPITAEQFEDKLQILPPMNWRKAGDFEVFCLMEPYHDSVHVWFARCEEKAFSFKHDKDASNDDLLFALGMFEAKQ